MSISLLFQFIITLISGVVAYFIVLPKLRRKYPVIANLIVITATVATFVTLQFYYYANDERIEDVISDWMGDSYCAHWEAGFCDPETAPAPNETDENEQQGQAPTASEQIETQGKPEYSIDNKEEVGQVTTTQDDQKLADGSIETESNQSVETTDNSCNRNDFERFYSYLRQAEFRKNEFGPIKINGSEKVWLQAFCVKRNGNHTSTYVLRKQCKDGQCASLLPEVSDVYVSPLNSVLKCLSSASLSFRGTAARCVINNTLIPHAKGGRIISPYEGNGWYILTNVEKRGRTYQTFFVPDSADHIPFLYQTIGDSDCDFSFCVSTTPVYTKFLPANRNITKLDGIEVIQKKNEIFIAKATVCYNTDGLLLTDFRNHKSQVPEGYGRAHDIDKIDVRLRNPSSGNFDTELVSLRSKTLNGSCYAFTSPEFTIPKDFISSSYSLEFSIVHASSLIVADENDSKRVPVVLK